VTQTVNELALQDVRDRLRGRGLALRTGPFSYRLRSDVRGIARGIARTYADFPVLSDHDAALVDYHVSLNRLRWLPSRCQLRIAGDAHRWPVARANIGLAWLEWGMNLCVYALGYPELVLHGAVVARGAEGVLLIGHSGSGKSTLCAALALDGWRLLSDELAIISTADGLLSGTARPVILKDRSIELIRQRYGQAVFGPLAAQTHKGDVAHLRPPGESVRRVDERVPPRRVYLVQYRAGARLRTRPVRKGRAMIELAKSSFNYGLLGRTGFLTLARLVDRCDCSELVYGNLDEALSLLERDRCGSGGEPGTQAAAAQATG
jgi:HprK-related kinase A